MHKNMQQYGRRLHVQMYNTRLNKKYDQRINLIVNSVKHSIFTNYQKVTEIAGLQ